MDEMVFIKVKDAIDNHQMLIRADLIFKIEEADMIFEFNDLEFDEAEKTLPREQTRAARRIVFTNGESEYVSDTMDELIDALIGDTYD